MRERSRVTPKSFGVLDCGITSPSRLTDKEIEQKRREDTPLRYPHLNLPPLAELPLIDHLDPSVTQVGDKPPLQISVEIRTANLLKESMVIDHVEGFAEIDAEETRSSCRLPLVETFDDGGDEGQKSGGGRSASAESVLRVVENQMLVQIRKY